MFCAWGRPLRLVQCARICCNVSLPSMFFVQMCLSLSIFLPLACLMRQALASRARTAVVFPWLYLDAARWAVSAPYT